MLRFTTFTVGDDPAYHARTWMLLLTTMAHAPADSEYVVVTDRPARYAWFGPRVRCLEPGADWGGAQGFFWRKKIKAVCAAVALGPADVVYADSDMVARRGFDDLAAALAAGDTFMHEFEHLLSRSSRKGDRAMWRMVAGRSAGGMVMADPAPMWNAGLVAVGAAKLRLFDDILAVCDDLTAAGVKHNLTEQFAWSVRLAADGRLRDGKRWFHHYWGNKPGWDAAINDLLARILVEGRDLTAAVELVRANPIRRPLLVRRRWWNRWFVPISGLQGHLDLPATPGTDHG